MPSRSSFTSGSSAALIRLAGDCVSRYSVILADPPWRYDFSRSRSRRIENHYPTMTEAEICAIPVQERWAAPDCVLFLWATAPKLEVGIRVMAAWGFRYVTCAIWDKQVIGNGFYFRVRHELLLLGRCGQPPASDPAVRVASVFEERRGRHSQKPAIVQKAIERMYPDARRIELFARQRREGWDAWGLDVSP